MVLYLDGAAFDYYYNTIGSAGNPIPDAPNYDHVKQALLKIIHKNGQPQYVIIAAVKSSLDPSNLVTSLTRMDAMMR